MYMSLEYKSHIMYSCGFLKLKNSRLQLCLKKNQGWAFTNPGLRTGKQTNKVYGCLRSLATRISVNSSFTSSFTAKCKVWFTKSSFTKHFNKSSFTKSLFTLISFTSSFVYCLFTNRFFTMDIMRFVYHYRLFT